MIDLENEQAVRSVRRKDMEGKIGTTPLSLRRIQVTDPFWKKEMELVRTEVIPYQWEALNDRVEGAAKSFCMRNFRVA